MWVLRAYTAVLCSYDLRSRKISTRHTRLLHHLIQIRLLHSTWTLRHHLRQQSLLSSPLTRSGRRVPNNTTRATSTLRLPLPSGLSIPAQRQHRQCTCHSQPVLSQGVRRYEANVVSSPTASAKSKQRLAFSQAKPTPIDTRFTLYRDRLQDTYRKRPLDQSTKRTVHP